MSINLLTETVVTLAGATAYLPKRKGRRMGAGTVWRWIRHGNKGIYLEAIRQPAGWITSVEAVQRFLERLADRTANPPLPRICESRELEIARARARLVAAGFDLDRWKLPPQSS